jgi:YjbE family integral membrane protein
LSIGDIGLNWSFISAFLSIIVIDVILSGDNAVVIAMAVRSLPPDQRVKGIVFGSGAAALLRVLLTFFVARLLQISFLKLVGGVLILWVAVKLLTDGVHEETSRQEAGDFAHAIKIILVADATMSLDNMLAIAGASHGNLFLLLFGLGLSIPFIMFTSGLLSMLMDKYPIIIYIGAAILGKVSGEMIVTDPVVYNYLHPSDTAVYIVEAAFAAAVIVIGKLWIHFKKRGGHQ